MSKTKIRSWNSFGSNFERYRIKTMRIVIATENASLSMSGEAGLPLYYFDRLRANNVDVWLVCHERIRKELRERYPDELVFQKIYFIKDSWIQALISKIGVWAPFWLRDMILGPLIYMSTQSRSRSLVKQLVQKFDIELVYSPTPISPKSISFMYGVGAPVVIGPMCGGLDFPPAFRYLESPVTRLSTYLGRAAAEVLNWLIPGKLQAEILLVANSRTAKALPKGTKGKVYEVVESGVDLSLWQPSERPESHPDSPTRFVYMARFVDQKGIPFLVEAFKQVAERTNSVLELIGSGELMEATQAQVATLQIQDKVNFYGWVPLKQATDLIRECDVYMVPAIRDCGGCAMLEAMAVGMPVIAANWAGPGDYADSSCGILVDLTSKEDFVNGLAEAMIRLAESPELRQQMGKASLERVRTSYFDWDAKVERVIEVFEEAIAENQPKLASSHAKPAVQS
ncbi:glycosyltransferase family 4 protein [Nodosilinea sp. E11]|uniref:glycosyltransferase family 4 protein n=1 Tax=Nodosilinea sp. E11 TaxID=3037479 RepID=UPI0029342ADD|nr:glycosyltransferase family 4 protein [Nodosilinea sp. E11]WOD37478.1 glycosyltransferase family 4 protein [Nodosilinea sp. E11]